MMIVKSPAEEEGPRHRWQDYEKIKQAVVAILTKNPNGTTGAKVAEVVGITQGSMSKYLSMLSVDGIITSRKVGVAKLWKLVSSSDRTELLADKMASEKVNFKDFAISLIEREEGCLIRTTRGSLQCPQYYSSACTNIPDRFLVLRCTRSFTNGEKAMLERLKT